MMAQLTLFPRFPTNDIFCFLQISWREREREREAEERKNGSSGEREKPLFVRRTAFDNARGRVHIVVVVVVVVAVVLRTYLHIHSFCNIRTRT